MNTRYSLDIDNFVTPDGYSPAAVRSFLFDANLALAAVVRLRKMGPWGERMLRDVDRSGALLDDDCPAGYAALQFLRYTIERGGLGADVRPKPHVVRGLRVVKRPGLYSKVWMTRMRREAAAEKEKRMSEKENEARVPATVWQPAHLQTLQEMWPYHTAEEIAARVPHSVGGITRMAAFMGFSRRSGYLSVSQVADELGVHSNTVLKWCRQGIIKAQRSRVVQCRMGAVWEIDREYYSKFRPLYEALPHSVVQRGPAVKRLMDKIHGRQDFADVTRGTATWPR